VHDLFAFFQGPVLKESFFGWVCGPPGSGKSVASLAFAFSLDRKDLTVMWIFPGE
jgi:KaiC/GvpD/RAD55 family RecA-like ATPase